MEKEIKIKVISIDIGIYHLGLVAAELNPDYTIHQIHDVDLIDITTGCKLGEQCNLEHGSNIADYMSHFFVYYQQPLQEADVILVEQQPPSGLVAVQELIRFQYRQKTQVVSPRSMHVHFDIGYLDYEARKRATQKIADGPLSQFKSYVFQERRHDISDAYCQLLFWSQLQNATYNKEQQKQDYLDNYQGVIQKMESFRFDEMDCN